MTIPRTVPPWIAIAVAAATVVVCALLLAVLPGGVGSDVSDVVQGVAALAAAVAGGRHAHRAVNRRLRLTWTLIAAACASWAAGEAYWASFTLRSDEVPFPSLADVGFLGFSLLMAVALIVHPHLGGRVARVQRALDALLTAGAIGLVAWLTVLAAVVESSDGSGGLHGLLLLAYPTADVLLIVLTVVLLTRAGKARPVLSLLSAGVLALGVSDGAFAYLAATGLYDGGLVDLGWIGGFALIALAGLCPAAQQPLRPADAPGPRMLERDDPARVGCELEDVTVSAAVLPYVPVLTALAVVAAHTLVDRGLNKPEMLTVCLVVLCLLARQYLAVRDNVRLARQLAFREGEMRRQAFADPLTGLANRLLFADRLSHVLSLHARDRRSVTLVYLDLDGFKPVNDFYGHAAGDELLRQVAARLLVATRVTDTVARLGGDEFAVLLEDSGDSLPTLARIEAALAPTLIVAGVEHQVRASIGVSAVSAADGVISADDLLARADAAMYAAKRARKVGTVSGVDRLPAA